MHTLCVIRDFALNPTRFPDCNTLEEKKFALRFMRLVLAPALIVLQCLRQCSQGDDETYNPGRHQSKLGGKSKDSLTVAALRNKASDGTSPQHMMASLSKEAAGVSQMNKANNKMIKRVGVHGDGKFSLYLSMVRNRDLPSGTHRCWY